MDLLNIINRFSDVRVLIAGDLMLDIFMYGSVNRISPEAPVPVFRYAYEKEMLGGAGNVAVNLAALGAVTSCLGFTGSDREGDEIASLLGKSGCRAELPRLNGHRTTVKTRLIASHNHILRADREEPNPDLTPILPALRQQAEILIRQADILLISDYAKGMITDEFCPFLIQLAKEANIPVIIDPKGADYAKYTGATLVKPNLKEFQEATGMTFRPEEADFAHQAAKGALFLFDKYKFKHLIVTLSEHGMIYFSAQNPDDGYQIPTQVREVFDVSGAGDTSFAALGAALGAGTDFTEALTLANTASGIVVGKLGTSSVSADELREKVREKNSSSRNKNIVTREELAEILKPLRAKGKKIGFTNGCFDLMHAGHLNSFAQARRECDILVVGVNSDRSVKSYKGPNRPIQDEMTRAALVASLKCVDYVVIFDETTAESLVNFLRPDVIAKEGYTLGQWPEARLVVSYGGRAVTLPRTEGCSTSDVIEKIRKIKE